MLMIKIPFVVIIAPPRNPLAPVPVYPAPSRHLGRAPHPPLVHRDPKEVEHLGHLSPRVGLEALVEDWQHRVRA